MLLRNHLSEDEGLSSLYVHIPFCQSRCIYCDFYSTTLGQDTMAQYIRAVEREMHVRASEVPLTRVHTIYIGGGTPSLLPLDLLHQLFDAIRRHFHTDTDAEVTIEANPDDITPEWLKALADLPINRISMGAQTFDDNLLRLIGRRHNAQQTAHAVTLCKQANITNISLDLIYGLPGQTMSGWQSDVRQALGLGITHLSAYALSYEEGTRLHHMLQKGLIEETDEELSRSMYDHLLSATEQAGFQHYEISNFALSGYHSRHNSNYWKSIPYLGIGAGAHSYDGRRTRRANLPDIRAYIAATADVPHETELLSDDNLYNEFIMTRLRTSGGIPLSELHEEDRRYCLSMAEPHLKHHLLHCSEGHLRLTREGIFTSNDIISDLLRVNTDE